MNGDKSDKIKHLKRYKMKEPERRGCPLKYAFCCQALDNDTLYSAACIVDAAIKAGLLDPDDKALHKRVRMSYNKIRHYREFPSTGDGLIQRAGQRPTIAFYGKRWSDAMDMRHFFSGRTPEPKKRGKSRSNKG